MKRVNEVLTTENSFFQTMYDTHGGLYDELFNTTNGVYMGFTEPSDMDMILLNECGERYASPLLSHHDMAKVVNFIVAKYGENWKRVKSALTVEYDVTKPYNVTQTTTGEKTATNDTTSESTDKTGVVGFDSETPTDSTVDTNNNTVNIAQTDTNNTTVQTVGNNGNVALPDLIIKEIEVRKQSFISLVISDIQSQITLDIY